MPFDISGTSIMVAIGTVVIMFVLRYIIRKAVEDGVYNALKKFEEDKDNATTNDDNDDS